MLKSKNCVSDMSITSCKSLIFSYKSIQTSTSENIEVSCDIMKDENEWGWYL